MAYESGRQKLGRDSLAEIARNTRKTATALLSGSGSGGAGLATETKQDTTIGLLQKIETQLNKDAWLTIPTNSVAYSYYAGVAAGNPSGNTNNIETAVFSDAGGVVFTQTFTYDANDNVLSIVVS